MPTQVFEESCGGGVILQSSFCCSNFSGRLQITRREEGGGRKRHAGKIRAYVRLDPGGGGGRGPNGDNNGIGRVVFNLALAGGLTYLTVTGKLGWVFDAFISLWVRVFSLFSTGFQQLGNANLKDRFCETLLQTTEASLLIPSKYVMRFSAGGG
jgi:hypothetical protein